MTSQIILKYIASFFSYTADILINIWFFNRVDNKDRRSTVVSYLPLILLFFLFFTPERLLPIADSRSLYNYAFQAGRLLYRWGMVYGYIRLNKDTTRRSALYLSGFSSIIYLTAQNIRILLQRAAQFAGASIDISALVYLGIAAEFLLFLFVRVNINIEKSKNTGYIRWALLSLGAVLAIYFKWLLMSTNTSEPTGYPWRDLLAFAFFASTGVFLILVLNERAQQAAEEKSRAQMERLTMEYEMQNAKRALQTNNDIRRLYHDMKNHLLAIQSMTEAKEQVQQYLGELLPQFDGYESSVVTGNSVVDALLSEKIQRAALDGIQLNICLDLSKLEFIKSVDMITIFGNALDNAIEAVQMLPDGADRMIYLKSSRFANLTALQVSNRFAGEIKQENGVLLTDKRDKDMHGIGLNSITKTSKRYGGTVEIRIDNEKGWFYLIILFPDQSK